MAESAAIPPAPCDVLPLERCPECDTALGPVRGRGACGHCGFPCDETSVWLFCGGVIDARLNGLLLAGRVLVGVLATAAIWISVGAVPGLAFGAMVAAGLAVHTVRHAALKRRDGNRPLLICPAGVGMWSSSKLTVRPWRFFTDVRMQALHNGSWRLMIRGGLWRRDPGGVFRADAETARRVQSTIERALRSTRSGPHSQGERCEGAPLIDPPTGVLES